MQTGNYLYHGFLVNTLTIVDVLACSVVRNYISWHNNRFSFGPHPALGYEGGGGGEEGGGGGGVENYTTKLGD